MCFLPSPVMETSGSRCQNHQHIQPVSVGSACRSSWRNAGYPVTAESWRTSPEDPDNTLTTTMSWKQERFSFVFFAHRWQQCQNDHKDQRKRLKSCGQASRWRCHCGETQCLWTELVTHVTSRFCGLHRGRISEHFQTVLNSSCFQALKTCEWTAKTSF